MTPLPPISRLCNENCCRHLLLGSSGLVKYRLLTQISYVLSSFVVIIEGSTWITRLPVWARSISSSTTSILNPLRKSVWASLWCPPLYSSSQLGCRVYHRWGILPPCKYCGLRLIGNIFQSQWYPSWTQILAWLWCSPVSAKVRMVKLWADCIFYRQFSQELRSFCCWNCWRDYGCSDEWLLYPGS